MYVLYDLLVHLILLVLSPYFVLKMISRGKYRSGIPERFGFLNRDKLKRLDGSGRIVWFHGVSVGETKAVMPIVKLFKERHPDVRIVFSTTTPTGNKVAKNEGALLIDALIYFPLDLSWVVRRVVRHIRPNLLVVVEKEIWPNVVRILKDNDVPVVIVNGTISERSFRRYKTLSFFFRPIFENIAFFCARTSEDARRVVELGLSPERVRTTGNIKFDICSTSEDRSTIHEIEEAMQLRPTDTIIVAGSTHPGEEEILLDSFRVLKEEFDGLRLVLAPRHPERFAEVESLIKGSGLSYSRRTSGGRGDVVLLDTVGELTRVYSLASVAFVGGSLVDGIGGHNLLEPAIYGKPVVYGSYLKSYLYMAEMLEAGGGGIRVDDGKDLVGAIRRLLSDSELRLRVGRCAKEVIEANRGATERCTRIIEDLLH